MHIAGLQELGWRGFFKKLYGRWSDNALTDRAAQLAYYFVFALFPFLSFLVTLTAYLPLQTAAQELLARLAEVMPSQAMQIITDQMNKLLGVQRPRLLTVSLLLAMWSASRGVDAIRTALNLAYDVKESRPFWRTQGMAIAITVVGAILVLASVTLVALGGKVNAILEHAAHEGKAAGARAPGEAPPPPEARPSAASPGAAKERTAAVRSQLRFFERRAARRAAARSDGGDEV